MREEEGEMYRECVCGGREVLGGNCNLLAGIPEH